MTTPLTADYAAADFDAPAGADPCAANTIDSPHVSGQLGYLATHAMPWLLYAFGISSSTSRPPVAIPGTQMPGYCAALTRTLRYISGAGRHGLSYTRQSEGFTPTGYCDASHERGMYRTASGFCKSRSGGCIVAPRRLHTRLLTGTTVNRTLDIRVRAHCARPTDQESARTSTPQRLRARRFTAGQRGLLRYHERHHTTTQAGLAGARTTRLHRPGLRLRHH